MVFILCSSAFLALAGCGGGSGLDNRGQTQTPELVQGPIVGQGAVNTGIEGRVVATVPELVPGSIRFRREALMGAEISIIRRADNEEIARTFSDTAGHFSLELAPGNYFLLPREISFNGHTYRAPSQILPLVPGRIIPIDIEYTSTVI
jgi:hypothetical protein